MSVDEMEIPLFHLYSICFGSGRGPLSWRAVHHRGRVTFFRHFSSLSSSTPDALGVIAVVKLGFFRILLSML